MRIWFNHGYYFPEDENNKNLVHCYRYNHAEKFGGFTLVLAIGNKSFQIQWMRNYRAYADMLAERERRAAAYKQRLYTK